jgi:hypothetical protein
MRPLGQNRLLHKQILLKDIVRYRLITKANPIVKTQQLSRLEILWKLLCLDFQISAIVFAQVAGLPVLQNVFFKGLVLVDLPLDQLFTEQKLVGGIPVSEIFLRRLLQLD